MATISEALTLAIQHHQSGRIPAAEQLYRQILAAEPNEPDAWHLLGVASAQLGKHQAAVESIRRALASRPDWPEAHNNLGNVFREQRMTADAVACYRQALKLNPDFAEAHNNLGLALMAEGRLDEAIASYRRALNLNPDFAEAHNNLGNAFKQQGNLVEAISRYRLALKARPNLVKAHNDLGNALNDQGKFDEAITSYRRALQLNDRIAEIHFNLSAPLKERGKLDEAVVCLRRAVELKPGHLALKSALVYQLQYVCDWKDLQKLSHDVIQGVDDDNFAAGPPVPPFPFLALPVMTTAIQQLHCSRHWVEREVIAAVDSCGRPAGNRRSRPKPKLTIGYLSGDFHSHATAWLIAELIEKQDRNQFAVVGYSYGPDDRSPIRRRLADAFDRFVDVKENSHREAAQRIAADEVDILVDLKGHTKNARPRILAGRPAPIQVNYLGYPGTMGASFVDYILVDEFVVPPEQEPFFTEKMVYLPGCYQVNDSQREIAANTPSKPACGLPDKGFVFCCFNNSYKITPEMFDVWMRLLKGAPGSVLWLLEGNRFAAANLRREAAARGVAAERLVFAPHLPLPEHLARYRVADLFLDTFPVNAHTTASDALWAGCPVLTLAGETFVSRVAGSLLLTLGLHELVATSLADYEAMGSRLARDAALLGEFRGRLAANRATSPLFDGGQFAANLEKAYRAMWELYMAGENPRSFAVTADRVNRTIRPKG